MGGGGDNKQHGLGSIGDDYFHKISTFIKYLIFQHCLTLYKPLLPYSLVFVLKFFLFFLKILIHMLLFSLSFYKFVFWRRKKTFTSDMETSQSNHECFFLFECSINHQSWISNTNTITQRHLHTHSIMWWHRHDNSPKYDDDYEDDDNEDEDGDFGVCIKKKKRSRCFDF